MKDKDKYAQLLNAVNKSGFPSPSIKESDFKEDIPVGNASVAEAANMVGSISSFLQTLEDAGVDLNAQNILLSTADFSWGNRNPFKVITKDNKSLAILRPNRDAVVPYLKSLLVQQAYQKSEKPLKDELWGSLSSILEQLEQDGKVLRTIKGIENSKDPTAEFIRYFYSSSSFSRALKQAKQWYTVQNQLESLVRSSFDTSTSLTAVSSTDPQVKSFSELIKDGRISMDQMTKVQDELGVSSPIEAVQELNNRLTEGPYFEISFIGAREIIFKQAVRKPLMEFDAINSEYYGESINPVATINGWNIAEYNGSYYVSDRILTTVQDLPDRSFSTINQARGRIAHLVQNEGLSAAGFRNQLKRGRGVVESRKKLSVGDRFVITDVKLDRYQDYPGNKELLKWKHGEFFDKVKSHPLWKKVNQNLVGEGLIMENILDTSEKLETFLALQDKLADIDRYRELYNRNTPRIDTPEKVEYSTNLAGQALQEIVNAKQIVYEIVDKNGIKYRVKRVEQEQEIPVFTKKTASFKSELVTISEYLQNTFGVTTNLVTSKEIADKFKKTIPNAARANAFIYQNQIYINVDKATTADALHEYAHIVMGTIKRGSPELYYGLLSKIEEHPMYALKLNNYNGDRRARTDLNEEVFVDIFGEYCARRMDPWFKDKTVQLDELKEKFKQGTQKMLQTGNDINSESVGRLLHMSINDIMKEFGSTLAEVNPEVFNMDVAHTSRSTSNLISKLLDSGKLIEDCKS